VLQTALPVSARRAVTAPFVSAAKTHPPRTIGATPAGAGRSACHSGEPSSAFKASMILSPVTITRPSSTTSGSVVAYGRDARSAPVVSA